MIFKILTHTIPNFVEDDLNFNAITILSLKMITPLYKTIGRVSLS